jgi:DNA modification methylase
MAEPVSVRILLGDCRDKLRELPDASVNCCVTSPPYFGLRDYGVEGQMGLEPTPDEFVAGMVEVFRDVRRVLLDDEAHVAAREEARARYLRLFGEWVG